MPTHRVVAGDDLSSLARRYYGDAAQWRLISAANPGVVGDAKDGLTPGALLIIPTSSDDAMDHAAAAVRPPYPDETGGTWHVHRGPGVTKSTEHAAARLRDRRYLIGLIAVAVIIAIVVASIAVFRSVRQGQLEGALAELPGIARVDVPAKTLDLTPDSTLPQVRAVVDTLIELRDYTGTGWTVRSGLAVLETNVFLAPVAADLLFATGRIVPAGIVRIRLEPVAESSSAPREVRIHVQAEEPQARAEASRTTLLALAGTAPAARAAVEWLFVSQDGKGFDWSFHGRAVVDADPTATALQAIARIPETHEVYMGDDANDIELLADSDREAAAVCRRARDQLAPQPLDFELQVQTSERSRAC